MTEALQLFRERRLRPTELLETILAEIDRRDRELSAYVSVDHRAARAAAAAADEAYRGGRPGPLCGLPLSLKDLIDVAGAVTGCGSRAPVAGVARQDATVVHRLKQAGAVLLGKTHLQELALGITGENPQLGTPRNPLDPSRIAGGSSSGSAVSVAAGLAVASVGTDTGGSTRVPAALCGLAGLKPSFGRVDRDGVFPLSTTMDHVGAIARTVGDLRAILSVLDGPDLAPRRRPAWRLALLVDLVERASRPVRLAVGGAVARLREAHQVDDAALPLRDELAQVYRTILLAEAATVHERTLADHAELLGAPTRELLAAGARITTQEYLEALARRAAFGRACDELLTRYDCLIAPTTLVPAPAIGQAEVEVDGRPLPVRDALLACTSPFSMIGLPALSVPCQAEGLPVGLQLVGPRRGDALVLELGEVVELLRR